ncbi:TonB-dependent receptor [Sagittula sp. NFXS13]|uniref:TonB-dependent receptor plug domain-containing protein n=1 Tax=Sagittula sp. NFXS13 TaxID=2819095 RepID=UPI0032DF726E
MTHARILCTTALCALASTAHAQAYDLGTLVLSGSLSPVPAEQTASTVEIIEEDALSVAADTPLLQTLSRQPGLSYSSNGGLGTTTNLRVRGLDVRYTAVRFDGIDMSDPSSAQTSFNFGRLSGTAVSRVEVLKGAQSALYGSEAIGGVINLESWKPTRDGASAEVALEAGSYETFIGSASTGYKSARGEIGLTFGRTATEGFSTRPGNDEDDGFWQDEVVASARYDVTEAVEVGFTAFWRDSELDIDRSNTNPDGQNFTIERGARVFAEGNNGGPLTALLAFSRYSIERDDPTGFTTFFDGMRDEAEFKLGYDAGGAITADFGLTGTVETAETSGFDEEDEVNSAAFGEVRWQMNDAATLSFALRHDDNSDFGGQTTGRLAMTYGIAPDLILRAVAGTGYRAPSLFERYSSYGNPDLDPENSRTAEIGIEKRYGQDTFVKATLFYTEIDDRIDYDFGTSTYNQVSGTTVSEGLELSGAYALNDAVTFAGAYTYTNAETDGVAAQRVPRYDLVLGVEADLSPRLRGSAEVQRLADIEASEFAPTDHKVGDYTLVNLGLSYDVMDDSELYMRVENALDEDYETAGGYNTSGRAVYVGIKTSF